MAKGNDEAHNPNRRPKKPGEEPQVPHEQTEEEKIEIIKQVFPDAQVLDSDGFVVDFDHDDKGRKMAYPDDEYYETHEEQWGKRTSPLKYDHEEDQYK